MGFLDKLLGRSRQMASQAADKSREMAGDVKEKAEGMRHGHEHGDGGQEQESAGESGGGTTPPNA